MLYERLKELKSEKNMTIQEISDKSGVPSSTVSRIFSGQTDNPSFQNICDIIVAMEGSLDIIAGISSADRTEKEYDSNAVLMQLCRERIEDKDREIKKWTGMVRMLWIAFLALVFIVMIILIIDLLHPEFGFIRY